MVEIHVSVTVMQGLEKLTVIAKLETDEEKEQNVIIQQTEDIPDSVVLTRDSEIPLTFSNF